MKTSKEIYSRLSLENGATKEQLKKIKKISVEFLKDITDLCDKNDIAYILAYGTFLGAVRHKGYIPWDDDIDISIYREDIPKLKKLIDINFPDKYQLVDQKRTPIFFDMIEVKGTKVYELSKDNDELVTGIKIDIFPFDKKYENPYRERLASSIQLLLVKLASLEQDFKYPSKALLEVEDEQVRKYYRTRRAFGLIASIFPKSFYKWLFINFCLKGKSMDLVCDGNSNNREKFPNTVIANRCKYKFEDYEFYGPKDYDLYLSTFYSENYMELPPEDKRETHSYLKVDLGELGDIYE